MIWMMMMMMMTMIVRMRRIIIDDDGNNNWAKANLFELAEDERELTEFAESRP